MIKQIIGYTIGGIISTSFAIILIFIKDRIEKWLKERRLKKQFKSLYEGFENGNLFKTIRSVKLIGETEIEQKLNCICKIYYKSEKVKLEGRIETINVDLNYYIPSKRYGNLKIEIRTERWLIIIGPVGALFFIIDNNKDKNKRYNPLRDEKTNLKVKEDFLNYLKEKINQI